MSDRREFSQLSLYLHTSLSDCVITTTSVHAGTPTIQQLLKSLKKLDNWLLFGVMLGVPVPKLKNIKSSHHQSDIELCKVDMLQYWLDNKLVSDWNEVIRALEETDQLALASQIKHEYLLSAAVNVDEGMCM